MRNEASRPSDTSRASPLQGWRIVITRSEDRAGGLAERLRALGAEPIPYPTIAFAPPEDTGALDAALQRLLAGSYDWLVLTSVTAVRSVHERLARSGGAILDWGSAASGPQSRVHNLKLAAVGASTAAACAELLGRQPAVVPETFVAEALAEALGDAASDAEQGLRGRRVLLANADIARPQLQEMLQAAGATVERVIAYRTVPASGGVDLPPLLAAGAIDAITFSSGSTVRYFVRRIGPDALAAARQTVIVCIGPVTAEAARAAGLPPTVVAETFSEAGLVEALVDWAGSNTLRRT